jgi:hypothetical protein
MLWTTRTVVAGILLALGFTTAGVHAADGTAGQRDSTRAVGGELHKTASWSWPEVAIYEELLSSYLDQVGADDELRQQVMEHWKQTAADARGPEFLDRLLNTACLVEPRVGQMVAQLRSTRGKGIEPKSVGWLTSDVPGWLQDAIRLACGRALAQQRLVDEALEAMAGLEVGQVCDPSTLLFYRASCSHQLLKRDQCLADVGLLLEREGELVARYAQVAKLMQTDIEPLESDSLDEIGRMMFDSHRRLDLGRAGQRVREEQQQILDKLDKLIENIEQQLQQQQQQQQQQAGQKGQQPQQGESQPLEQSQAAGGSGPGDVDKKDVGKRADWGNLPPAERQEALQQITEKLPSHYRDVIESYFRQLAKDRGP